MQHAMIANRWQQRTVRVLVGLAALELLALAIHRALIRVRGTSMLPSLWPGDLLLTVPARIWRLRPGQVVVVADPGDPDHLVVKRLTATGPGGIEVHGDDPTASTDSRTWGALPRRSVRRVAVRRWPDLRTRLAQPGRRASTSSSGSSSATSPEARAP